MYFQSISYYFTDSVILILRHDVKNVWFTFKYSLRKMNVPKYGLPWIFISPSMILLLYEKIRISLFPYMGKYGSEKSRILAYLTQWLGRNNSCKLGWLHDFKVWFLLKTHCDRATCKWNYQKTFSKLVLSRTFVFPTFSFFT